MKLYLISEQSAKYLMRAPYVLGGYVLTGESYQHLPNLPGYLAKLPATMAESVQARPVPPDVASRCIGSLERSISAGERGGVMARLAAEARDVAAIIMEDLRAIR